MTDRKQKVEELLADLQSLRRTMAFRSPASAKATRITPSQWGALMCVEQRGESTVKGVAKALGITSSAATQLVDGLVTNGYLMRETSREDRRTVKLTLSKKSANQVAGMKKFATQRFLKMFEALKDKEFNQYITLNKKILQGLSKRRQMNRGRSDVV